MYTHPRANSPGYDSAAVCKRGHVRTAHIEQERGSIEPRCSECGALILTECPKCHAPIKGRRSNWYGVGYVPPQFCINCGAPMPWSSRESRLYELENILDEQKLSDADRLTIREQLDILRNKDVSEEEQIQRWKVIKKISPSLIDIGKEIVISVTSELIQKQIGLK